MSLDLQNELADHFLAGRHAEAAEIGIQLCNQQQATYTIVQLTLICLERIGEQKAWGQLGQLAKDSCPADSWAKLLLELSLNEVEDVEPVFDRASTPEERCQAFFYVGCRFRTADLFRDQVPDKAPVKQGVGQLAQDFFSRAAREKTDCVEQTLAEHLLAEDQSNEDSGDPIGQQCVDFVVGNYQAAARGGVQLLSSGGDVPTTCFLLTIISFLRINQADTAQRLADQLRPALGDDRWMLGLLRVAGLEATSNELEEIGAQASTAEQQAQHHFYTAMRRLIQEQSGIAEDAEVQRLLGLARDTGADCLERHLAAEMLSSED